MLLFSSRSRRAYRERDDYDNFINLEGLQAETLKCACRDRVAYLNICICIMFCKKRNILISNMVTLMGGNAMTKRSSNCMQEATHCAI